MSTSDNLKDAFAGESQANRTYTAFARQAQNEKLSQVARLFRAAAEAETVHALMHLRTMGGIRKTAENLRSAVEGEHYEFTSMYPKFLEEAQAEGNRAAATGFRQALQVEEVHHRLYTEALKAAESGNDLPEARIFVCSICGNTVLHEAPDVCDICGAVKERFFEVH